MSGWVVWLTAGVETIYQRLQSDPSTWDRRPALMTSSPQAEVAALLRLREPHYRGCAHLTVSTEGRSPESVVAEIQSAFSDRSTPVTLHP
jgi:shikimate kinase